LFINKQVILDTLLCIGYTTISSRECSLLCRWLQVTFDSVCRNGKVFSVKLVQKYKTNFNMCVNWVFIHCGVVFIGTKLLNESL